MFEKALRVFGAVIAAICILYTTAFAQLPAVDNGVAWISSAQNADKSWGKSPLPLVTPMQTTIETVFALRNFNSVNTAYNDGLAWLSGQPIDTVEFMSNRIIARAYAGLDTSSDLNTLLSLRNAEGFWGAEEENRSNSILDTAFALHALKSANYSDQTVINSALAYLTGSQNPDGGWGFIKGDDSNVYLTAIVSTTLQQFPQMTTIATAVSKASSYLLAHQNSDGGFGSSSTVYETALAYVALVAVGQTQGLPLQNAINCLTTTQSANGSWNDDPYSTALALKALYLSENKPSPPPPPPAGGKITGTVIDKITNQPVGNVAVVLNSNNLINTTTDSSGNFNLSDITPGSQKVNFSLSGYAATNATATVVVDTTASLGTIPMTSSYSTGTIAGTITDSTGKPLTGVAISISGAWSGSATTGADGTYSFTYVTPGTVTISAAKTGFQAVTANGSVYARTTLTFSPRMSTTASQATTGTLVGRVVDSYWGLPMDHLPGEKGVTVTLSGGISAEADPDNRGNFTIPNLAPGTYQVIVGMLSFATFRVVITPGGITDLGTIRLDMSIMMALTGKITDASTGAPIPGAEVIIQGKDFTSRTDFAGTYAITDIPTPGEYTVKVSADGYVGKSYTVGSSPWLHTMDFALSQRITKGSLTGSVIDAATSQPLVGVTLTLMSDPSLTTTTNSTGSFTFNAVPQGPQQVTLALGGYSTRTLTTAIIAGAVNDAGNIPLGVTELPATIRGRVKKAGADNPFAGVAIQATGNGSQQTVTAADGTYLLEAVPPGTVTVTADAMNDPGFTNARLSAILEPGGILVFNPSLSMMLPDIFDLTVQTDKAVYGNGDRVGLSVNLRNRGTEDIAAQLHVRVTDPAGANVYETSVNENLAADGAVDRSLNFPLPALSQSGRFKVLTEAYDATGSMLGNSYKYFGVTVSQIAVTPALPAAFVAGTNTLSFTLVNNGTLPVSAGTLAVTLKDPEGQVVSSATQNFSLALGETKSVAATLAIPALKFGTYTLTYVQSDETKNGQATDVTLPNTLAVTALFDDASHRIRGTANLTVTVRNTGRFDLGSASVTAAVPDAAYSETKPLSPAPVVGNISPSALLYQFAIPETMAPGQHGTRITVTLPSGSTTAQTAQLAILESSLSLSPLQTTFTAGETIRPVIANSGGVDTPVQYRISLYDAKAALIAETTNIETATAGSSLSLALAIPAGAVDGSYNLLVTYKDTKTGKEATVPNGITVNGVKGAIQVQTGKQSYLLTENIAGTSSMISSGTPLTGGNLHLQVTTGLGAQKNKTWTTQADFQVGVRSGVDTYGVNDWIIPDDDFSGTAVNVDRWKSFVNNGGVLPANTGEQLQLETSGKTVSISGVDSNFKLDGDFDAQVDFEMNPFMNNNSHAVFIAYFDDGSYFRVGRQGNYYQSYKIWPEANQTTFSSDTKGKLRLTRTGNVAKTWYWTGSQWINHSTWTVPTTPIRINLQANSHLGTELLLVKFDNFKVNSGRIKTENQTVDSVRLLPLNDNFDDGVLNEDRWIVDSKFKPTENYGLVQLTSTAVNPFSYLNPRALLAGDFSAVSVYKNYAATPSKTLQGRYIMHAGAENSSIYINRQSYDLSRGGGELIVSLSQINGSWQMTNDFPYPSDSGQFRLRREGTTAFTDYWNGTQWVNQHSRAAFPSVPASISLYTYSQENMPTIKVDIDRFYTNKGTYNDNGKISLKYDSTASGNKWGKLIHSSTQPVGTSIKFRTRTAETEAGLATATWSDYLTTSGSAITSPAARWIEIEATLATTNTNVTPLLHDVTVTYEANPGEILWQTDVPASLAQGAVNQLNHTIGTLGMTGKFYLEGTLTSSTGQTVAYAEYPFYVEQGNIQIHLAPDKKIYRPGETVSVTGEVRNLSSIAATGLIARVQGTGVTTPYSEGFDLAANSAHPFSITTTAGNDGIYQLTGSVTQNSTTLADVAGQYEVASPVVTATLTAPDTVGNVPFTVSVSLNNTGKVSATTKVNVVDDSGNVLGDQFVTLPAGESRMLSYTRQIFGLTTYTAAMSGDLNQTLTKNVSYAVVATDSSVSGKIVTDKASYNPNEQVTLTTTLSAGSARENLSTLITVTNNQGQAVYSAAAVIQSIIRGQTVTSRNYWNSGTYPAGTYLVTLQVIEPAGSAIGKATCNLVINSTTRPTALLKGKLSLDKQSILTGEIVAVSYSVTNTGNVDLANIPLSIRTVNMAEQTVYDTIADQVTLAMGAAATNSSRIDTRNYSAKDYLVILRATINGVEETLAGSYFRVEGAPSAPALTSPASGSDVDTLIPVLTVSNAADPNDDKLTYEFEIYSDSGLTQLVTSGTIPETTGTTAWTVPAPLTENLSYSWRARAYDGRLYGPWMIPASFRVNMANDPPAAPAISSPADASSVAVLTPALTVGNASDPDSANLTYNFEVALDPDFSRIVASAKGIPAGPGATSWQVSLPLVENGWYFWRAQADDWLIEGPWSTTARFLVNTANESPSAPIITTPSNGSAIAALATDVVVTNSSDPDSSSLSYYFEADTVPTFDSTNIIRSGSVAEGQRSTLWYMAGLLDNTRYHIRVKASDGSTDSPWSAVTGFFANTVNDPPTTPTIANPSNGAGVNVLSPTLSVHKSSDPDRDILTYEFAVYADAAMANLVTQASGIAEQGEITSWTTPVTLTENMTYYWHARVFDGSLNSNWTLSSSFTVNTANDAPGSPTLSSPTTGSSVATLTPTLAIANAVDPDSDTLSYEFEIYNGTTLVASTSGIPGHISGFTSWAPGSALNDNTVYQWRARAYDGDRFGPWTAMAAFTVHMPKTSINATIDFDPNTLNKSSNGTWVVVYIELPAGYDPVDIDISSIRLEGTIPAETRPSAIGDHDKDGIPDLMVKCRRSSVISLLKEGDIVPVHVTGKVGSTQFDGVDVIRVIQ